LNNESVSTVWISATLLSPKRRKLSRAVQGDQEIYSLFIANLFHTSLSNKINNARGTGQALRIATLFYNNIMYRSNAGRLSRVAQSV
jgi:hypothetical protein